MEPFYTNAFSNGRSKKGYWNILAIYEILRTTNKGNAVKQCYIRMHALYFQLSRVLDRLN
jgi:hypothetical protein